MGRVGVDARNQQFGGDVGHVVLVGSGPLGAEPGEEVYIHGELVW